MYLLAEKHSDNILKLLRSICTSAYLALYSGVTRRGGGPPRVTPSRGVTPEGKNLWANLQRIVEKRGPRTGKKGVG